MVKNLKDSVFVGFHPTYALRTFKKYVKQGFYQEDWCNFDNKNNILDMDLE